MKRPGHKNFNAVSHNRLRPEVLFLNLTWRSRGQISSVLLQLLLFAFRNRKFGRPGKWSVTFWQWENNTYDRTWLWDTALKFFGRAFSLRHQITWKVVQKLVNANPAGLKVNQSINFSCNPKPNPFTAFVLCSLRLFKFKTDGQPIYWKPQCHRVTKLKSKLSHVLD